MKIILNDIKVERLIIGHMALQIQFRKEGSEDASTWQIPLKIGQPVEQVVRELHEFAELIRLTLMGRNENILDQLKRPVKRDCPQGTGLLSSEP